MGSLHRRGRVWYAKYQDGNSNWITKSTRQRKKALAYKVLQRMEAEAQWGGRVILGIRLGDFAKTYIDEVKHARLKSPNTISNDKSSINKWLVPFFGDKLLSEITEALVFDYQKNARRQRLKARTINKHVDLLSAMLRHAVKSTPQRLARMPWDRIPHMAESDSRLGETLTRSQVMDLMESCEGPAKLAIALMAYTGIRRGSCVELTWDRIDLEARVIRLDPSNTKQGEWHEVYFDDELAEILEEFQGKGRLFNVHVETIGDWVRKAMQDAGVWRKGVGCHALRHAFVTDLLRSGVDIQTVSKMAGHTNISVTAKYAHTDEQHQREALSRRKLKRDKVTVVEGHFTGKASGS